MAFVRLRFKELKEVLVKIQFVRQMAWMSLFLVYCSLILNKICVILIFIYMSFFVFNIY